MKPTSQGGEFYKGAWWCKTCCGDYQKEYRRRRLEEYRQRQAAEPPKAEPRPADATPARCLHSFSFELQPGQVVRFVDIPDDLTRQQANKLKRLVSAYVEPAEGDVQAAGGI